MANTPLERLEQGNAPLGMRMAIAEGLLPLEGDELVAALGFLVEDSKPEVLDALRENLPTMPRGFLQSTAHRAETTPGLLHFLAETLIDDEEIVQAVILNRQVATETLVLVAENGPPAVLEVLAQNRNKMLEYPIILVKLLENEHLSRVTHYALEEFRERFQIDLDADYSVSDDGTGEAASMAGEDGTDTAATAVAEPGAMDAETAGVSDTDTRDVETPDVDLDAADAFAVPDDAAVAGDGDAESLMEDTLSDEVLENVKGFDSGWDIDTLVKEVGGDAGDLEEETGAFDDLLDITVLEEEEDEEGDDDWLGEDIAATASEEGLMDDESDEDDADDEKVSSDTRIRLMGMTAAEKLILAKVGTKQERAILVTDANKKVAVAVVEGPKMTEFEIQLIAKNRQVYEDVLRAIAQHREWGQSTSIRRELVLNPKTPLSVSTRLLSSLNEFVLKDVVKSKDIPPALVNHAKRVLEVRERRRGT